MWSKRTHEYQQYLALQDIEHTKTKAKSPQTNGICERFHRTMQDEFYATPFHKKIYNTLDKLQVDVDVCWNTITMKDQTRENIAMEKHRCKHAKRVFILQKRKSYWVIARMLYLLSLSGEKETGPVGEQPASDKLTDWNSQGGQKSPSNYYPIPRNHGFENPAYNR